MCHGCYIEAGGDEVTPTPDLAALTQKIEAFYSMDSCGTGGFLHIVLDDMNIEDGDIKWCVENVTKYARNPASIEPGLEIANALLALPESERAYVILNGAK